VEDLDTGPTVAELEALRDVVRDFLSVHSAESAVREATGRRGGYDAGVWELMSRQLGLPALAIPEEYGGAGYSLREMGVVLEEAGRALLCAPLLSSAVLAAQALLMADDAEAAKEHLPGIADGTTVAAVALTCPGGAWQERNVAVTYDRNDAGWQLTGVSGHVLDGAEADLLLVLATGSLGPTLFRVDPRQPEVTRRPLVPLDLTRAQAEIRLEQAPARPFGTPGEGWHVTTRLLDVAALALACEQVGGAARVLEQVVDHVRAREQFGRPIGSFQAVKHSCAEMLVEVESARSAAYALRDVVGEPDRSLVHVTKAYCSRAYSDVASRALQLYGGLGFTWEHPVHLHLKRARSSEVLFGTSDQHLVALADTLPL
jgi:alkylation response protein AidB-like acyl-CoA dehydrogenase